jgi:hypothetical protein
LPFSPAAQDGVSDGAFIDSILVAANLFLHLNQPGCRLVKAGVRLHRRTL